MGALPKRTEILRLNGTLKHNPGLYAGRANEPKPNAPLGLAPKELDPELVPFWNEIRAQLACMPGVAMYTDRYLVERLCRLVFKLRKGTLTVNEGGQMINCLARLGMTPVDRCRLQVTPSKKTTTVSPFAKISTPPPALKTGTNG